MTNLIIACALAGVVSLILGFVWYHPKVFGTAWMEEVGLSEEQVKNANMPVTFGFTFLITMYMGYEMKWVNHPDDLNPILHGMYHGIRNIGVFAIGAIIINGLMEQKSLRYMGINVGYWLTLFAIIGAMFASFPSFRPPKTEETSLKIDIEKKQLLTENNQQIYVLTSKS